MSVRAVLFAFGLTVLAGLSTGIGSALAFYTKQTNKKFLSAALGFSAGVMIYVSMIEIFVKARASLEHAYGPTKGYWITTLGFFAGIAIIAFIDRFVPSAENPHEMRDVGEMAGIAETSAAAEESALMRMGLFSELAIAIHNIPEGPLPSWGTARSHLGCVNCRCHCNSQYSRGYRSIVPIFFATGSRLQSLPLLIPVRPV